MKIMNICLKNYINNKLLQRNNFKHRINEILNDIEFKNNEFIVLSGKLSSNKELVGYRINMLNISDEKADLIIKKLNSLICR